MKYIIFLIKKEEKYIRILLLILAEYQINLFI